MSFKPLSRHKMPLQTPPKVADKYACDLAATHQRPTPRGRSRRAKAARSTASTHSGKTLLYPDRGCICRLDAALRSAFRQEASARYRRREVEQLLSDLAVQRNISASTQNQAKSTLLFLYRDVLGRSWIGCGISRKHVFARGRYSHIREPSDR